MTGTARSSEGLDPRRRKLLFRAWHRGMREMDLIMGGFADARVGHIRAEVEKLDVFADAEAVGAIVERRRPA